MEKSSEYNKVCISGKEFYIIKLEPWKRLTFIADFQKEFLVPVINSIGNGKLSNILNGDELPDNEVMSIISSLSQTIDGKTVEKWAKRITDEGVVIYINDNKEKVKLSFVQLNDIFKNPIDIIVLMKDAIIFNMEGVSTLFDSFKGNQSNEEGI